MTTTKMMMMSMLCVTVAHLLSVLYATRDTL